MMTYRMVRLWLDKIGNRWNEMKTTEEWKNLDRILREMETAGQQDNQIPEVAEALEALKGATLLAVARGLQTTPRPPAGCLDEPHGGVGDPR